MARARNTEEEGDDGSRGGDGRFGGGGEKGDWNAKLTKLKYLVNFLFK